MDINRAVSTPFRDSEWPSRAALAGVWYLVPFLSFAVTGWGLDYIRSVSYGQETPLPGWQSFGRYWVRGLLAGLGYFVFALPGILVIVVASLPLIVSLIEGEGVAIAATAGTLCFAYLIAGAYFIFISVFVAAAQANYAMRETYGAFFAVGEIYRCIRAAPSEYFTAWAVSLVVWLVMTAAVTAASMILGFIPIVGTFATMFLTGFALFPATAVTSHLYGQYAVRAYGTPGLPPLQEPTYSAQGWVYPEQPRTDQQPPTGNEPPVGS